MKKRSFGLVLLLAVLVIVIGFYLFAASVAKKNRGSDPVEDTAIVYLEKEAEDVAEITYRSGSYTYGIKVSGSIYRLLSDSQFPLDQTVAASMAEAVAVITFDRRFQPEGNDLSSYGLADPQTVLTVTYDDGAKLTLEIGQYNKYTDSYYCQLGDGFVYLLNGDLLTEFDYTMTDLLQDETVTRPSDGSTALTKIEVTRRDGAAFTYELLKAESEDEEDTWRKVLSDGTVAAGEYSEEVLALYRELFMVSLDEWAAYNATGEETLSAYGLSSPAVSVVFHYHETVTLTPDDSSSSITKVYERAMGFLVGDRVASEDNADTEGTTEEEPAYTRYFLLEGGKVVYLVDEENLTQTLS